MTQLVFEANGVQLRRLAKHNGDGLGWFICSTNGEYDVPWFDSTKDLLAFATQIQEQFGV